MNGSTGDTVAEGKPYVKWRMFSLIGIHILFLTHFIHWKLAGRTLAPLELNEVLYTIHQGILTAGFILMAVVMIGTLIFGRFFCSWGCHILALQDLSEAILKKLGIRPIPVRSRTLIWIPMAVMFYMFIWPQILATFHGVPEHELRVVTAESGGWASFITDSPWRNLPPVEIAMFTFFICGFLIVFLLGSRGFCYMGCPYGALFGIADQFASGRIALTGNCTDCGICSAACSSDILVHKEVQQHQMVTNPRCLKDLDCVAACPENALSFAFRKPPMFRKGHPLGKYPHRSSFTLKEDLLLLGVFIFSILTFRGLYDAVPLLLSVGLAVCVAIITLWFFRAISSSSFTLKRVLLRSNGKWLLPGKAFITGYIILGLFMAHSSVIQFIAHQAKSEFKNLNSAITEKQSIIGYEGEIEEAISSYERVLGFGFVEPIDMQKELANLHLLNGNTQEAIKGLKSVLVKDPSNIEAGYRLATIYAQQGDGPATIKLLNQVVKIGEPKPHTNDIMLLAKSHLKLGKHHLKQKNVEDAKLHFKQAISIDSNQIEPRIALGHLAYESGNLKDALLHFETALTLGGKTPVVLNNLAAIHAMEGRSSKAIDYLAELAELDPSDSKPPYRIGLLALANDDLETAEASLNQAKKLNPIDPKIDKALARLKIQLTKKTNR